MKVFYAERLAEKELEELCIRKAVDNETSQNVAASILARVKEDGDKALFDFAKKYDGVSLESLAVSANEIREAVKSVNKEIKKALDVAADNITKFHEARATEKITVETMPGVVCFAESRPVEKVGLYIPGGTASLPSTVLMLAIPAKLAGCKDVILCTPPGKDGKVDKNVLCAASLCGVDRIYKLGGAQAIAAMAYGTESVPRVFKIFGPGNQYVTAAKQLVSIDPDGAAIDMPAGPTEVLVVADKTSRADFVAADLLSQAEHGVDSAAILVCSDEKKTKEILAQTKVQLKTLPRGKIAEQALSNSFALVVADIGQAVDFANRFAPEHLILGFDSADNWTDKVINAGSVFIGPYSSESAGDYASGPNHSLPTYGYARAYSGVSTASFQRIVTFQKVTPKGARNIGPTVELLAEQEGLVGHKRAMELRQ